MTQAQPAGTKQPGQTRKPLTVVLLTIVTLGIYGLFWYYRMYQDMKDYRGRGIGGLGGLLLGFFCSIINIFLLPSEVEGLQRDSGREVTISALAGFWTFIPIAGGIIWVYKIQNRVNEVWEAAGGTPAGSS